MWFKKRQKEKESSVTNSGELTSILKIGNQFWSTANLNSDTFNNGQKIFEAKSESEWRYCEAEKLSAFCYFNFDSSLGDKYGKLYNWYAVTDPRGLVPFGYRIPKREDWIELFKNLGAPSPNFDGIDVFEIAGEKMKSINGWDDYQNKSGNGTNESGFNGFPCGEYMDDAEYDGAERMYFHGLGFLGCWWSISENANKEPIGCLLRQYADYVTLTSSEKHHGQSVRFIKITTR